MLLASHIRYNDIRISIKGFRLIKHQYVSQQSTLKLISSISICGHSSFVLDMKSICKERRG